MESMAAGIGKIAHTVESEIGEVTGQAYYVVSNTWGLGSSNKQAHDFENLKKPVALVLGGSQGSLSDEMKVVESLLDKTDVLVLTGGIIFAFYKAKGLAVGSTVVDDEELAIAKSILAKAEAAGVKVVLPEHVVVTDDDQSYDANKKVVPASEIPEGWYGMDMAPESVDKIINESLNGVGTVISSGLSPVTEMGFEVEELEKKGVRKIDVDPNDCVRIKSTEEHTKAGNDIGMFHFGG